MSDTRLRGPGGTSVALYCEIIPQITTARAAASGRSRPPGALRRRCRSRGRCHQAQPHGAARAHRRACSRWRIKAEVVIRGAPSRAHRRSITRSAPSLRASCPTRLPTAPAAAETNTTLPAAISTDAREPRVGVCPASQARRGTPGRGNGIGDTRGIGRLEDGMLSPAEIVEHEIARCKARRPGRRPRPPTRRPAGPCRAHSPPRRSGPRSCDHACRVHAQPLIAAPESRRRGVAQLALGERKALQRGRSVGALREADLARGDRHRLTVASNSLSETPSQRLGSPYRYARRRRRYWNELDPAPDRRG